MSLRCLAALALMACSAAHADEPLISEDTGVIAPGQWQVELHGERAHDREDGRTVVRTHASATLARGIADGIEAQVDVPWTRLDGQAGPGDLAVGAKWRFYERGGFSAAFKPEVLLPTGRDQDGLGAGRAGWRAGMAVAREWASFSLIAHARYTANRNRIGEREALRHGSLALLWSASDRLKLVLDYARETSPDRSDTAPARSLVYGVLYAISQDADFGIGYQQGRSAPAEDRVVRAGLKLRW